ncbi:MAG TPA: transposase, partial [Pyrinomonadaceae bacterium]|nr:transposase [Pyrinomonadaceae bacterium]
ETIKETLTTAADNVEKAKPKSDGISELVADKGYHSNELLEDLTVLGMRTYISEPARGRRNWQGKQAARNAVYGNRRRIGGARGRRLLRQRGERLERPFAHAYQTGGLRRVYLRGHSNILKRVLIHIAALNLGLLMRLLIGVGTPRSLQGRLWALLTRLVVLWGRLTTAYLPPLCESSNREPFVIGMRAVLCS